MIIVHIIIGAETIDDGVEVVVGLPRGGIYCKEEIEKKNENFERKKKRGLREAAKILENR